MVQLESPQRTVGGGDNSNQPGRTRPRGTRKERALSSGLGLINPCDSLGEGEKAGKGNQYTSTISLKRDGGGYLDMTAWCPEVLS